MRVRFAGFRLDDGGLSGPQGRVRVSARDARLLRLLVEADGRVVSKQSIADIVWQGQPVSDESIVQAVRRLRLALPAPPGMSLIETVYGEGVRMGVPVVREDAEGSRRPASRGTDRIEAEACLVSARELSSRRTPESLAAAIDAAQHALQLDPRFVTGWCTLAEFHLMRVLRSLELPRSGGASVAAAADEALALDAACAPALALRGYVKATIERDVAVGLADLDRSVALDAGYWVSRGLRGWALLADGRVDDALAEVEAAGELNPWSSWYSGMRAQYLFYAGKATLALDAARESMRRFPDSDYAPFVLSHVASSLGMHDEAIAAGAEAARLAPGTPLLHTSIASALAYAGRRDEALDRIRAIESAPYPLPAVWLAPAWLALGDRRRALEMLDLARESGAPQYVYTRFDSRFAPLLQDRDARGHAIPLARPTA